MRRALVLMLGASLLGAAGMWVGHTWLQVHDMQTLALVHELEVSGLCANGLTLNLAEDRDRLSRLLAQRLDSALEQASRLTDEGVRMHIAGPNLKDSVRRAAAYYAATGDTDRQKNAETLLATLSAGNE
jgi:hypothetical protein